jgi:hypothetical protein
MFWSEYQERLVHPEKVPAEARWTAFYILKRFYDRGVRTRRIGWREFARFVGKDKAHVVERLLAEGTWLVFTGPYERQEHSRVYTLAPSMWPARPGEPRQLTPW